MTKIATSVRQFASSTHIRADNAGSSDYLAESHEELCLSDKVVVMNQRFSCAWIALVVCGLGASAAQAQPEHLLFFGNSFTNTGGTNVPNKVGQLAAADGYPAPNIVTDPFSGADLAYHIGQVDNDPNANVNQHSIPNGQTWDYVIIQGNSTEPTHLGDPAGFVDDALSLYRRVLNHSSGHGAGVKAVLFETWARAPGHSFYSGATPDFTSPTAMQAEVRAGYEAAQANILANEGPGSALLAPVGDGFEAMNFDLLLYNGDRYHANVTGSLLASMIIYRTIYGEDVGDIDYAAASAWAGVDANTWAQLATTADALPIPEPGTAAVMGAAAVVLLRRRRRSSY